MLELVDPGYRTTDLSWIDRAMADGTLVCCADGSYRKKVSPYVSGVGWVIQYSKTNNYIECCFYKVSDSANVYRVEQLGVDALHHLLAAFSVLWQKRLQV